MSLKRFALIAAVSYHNSHQNHTASTPTMTTTKSTLQQQQQILVKSTATSEIPATTTTTNPAAGSTQLTAGVISSISSSSNNNSYIPSAPTSNSATGSAIPTYYGGGLGLFHQQNIRANAGGGSSIGGGIGLMNGGGGGSVNGAAGSSYPNAINGNVNLLLGGAMLSLVTTVLCVVCYCCHRNIKKRTEAAYRQQRQWLENDPNMEIYSVEQCYETSGLFLGESTDGLATLPTLHHEPPPSYDAVVAMQEQQLLQQQQQQHQQQQQLMLLELEQQQHHHQMQRSSPPPGYRSSLDVSGMITMAAAAVAASGSRGTPDGMATTSDSNGNLSGGQQKSLNGVYPMMNMKKVLSAQSCCSLQRAEVENMWNAAAAAVAARAAHSSGAAATTTTTTITSPEQVALRTPTTMARKSLPAYAGAKLSVNEFGRRYLNQNYYRRGCPLCGKFCYNEGENEGALSLSTESLGLDSSAALVATEAAATVDVKATADKGLPRLFCHEDCDNGNVEFEQIRNETMFQQSNIAGNPQHFCEATRGLNATQTSRAATAFKNDNDVNVNEAGNDDDDDNDDDNDTCSCASKRRATTARQRETISTGLSNRYTTQQPQQHHQQQQQDKNANENDGNDDENGNGIQQSIQQIDLEATSYAPASDVREFVAAFACGEATPSDDNNANPTITATAIAEITSAATVTATSASLAESIAGITPTTSTLDSINENGIIRLDMSKIIDRTGLPTYEAALKLESSGYV